MAVYCCVPGSVKYDGMEIDPTGKSVYSSPIEAHIPFGGDKIFGDKILIVAARVEDYKPVRNVVVWGREKASAQQGQFTLIETTPIPDGEKRRLEDLARAEIGRIAPDTGLNIDFLTS